MNCASWRCGFVVRYQRCWCSGGVRRRPRPRSLLVASKRATSISGPGVRTSPWGVSLQFVPHPDLQHAGAVQTNVVRPGRKFAARFELRHGDQARAYAVATVPRSAARSARGPTKRHLWYRWSTLFDVNFPAPQDEFSEASQWHANQQGSPSVAIAVGGLGHGRRSLGDRSGQMEWARESRVGVHAVEGTGDRRRLE